MDLQFIFAKVQQGNLKTLFKVICNSRTLHVQTIYADACNFSRIFFSEWEGAVGVRAPADFNIHSVQVLELKNRDRKINK